MSTITDLALTVYQWAADLRPTVYVALMIAVMLIAMMKYDDRKRAKRDADSSDHKPVERETVTTLSLRDFEFDREQLRRGGGQLGMALIIAGLAALFVMPVPGPGEQYLILLGTVMYMLSALKRHNRTPTPEEVKDVD